MTEDQVKQIEELTKQLGSLIIAIDAKTSAHWDAVEKLTAAHKQLRSIEIAELIEFKHL